MRYLNAYLKFNGNCKEAMSFYKDCFGGELTIQKVEDSPLKDKMSPDSLKKVMHATLLSDGLVILGSDMIGSEGLTKGNSILLSVT